MRLSRSMVLLVLSSLTASLLVGCTTPPPPPPPAPAPQPPTQAQADEVQANILKIVPGSLLGKVAAVRGNMAAVSGIAYTAVVPPKSIQFLNGNSVVIASGDVSSATDPASQYLIVEFTPVAGGRAPIDGDLAVYMPPAH